MTNARPFLAVSLAALLTGVAATFLPARRRSF
jgi:hypothetical protein